MTRDEHRILHIELHGSLANLISDFVCHNGSLQDNTTIHEFVIWSFKQSINPTNVREEAGDEH